MSARRTPTAAETRAQRKALVEAARARREADAQDREGDGSIYRALVLRDGR